MVAAFSRSNVSAFAGDNTTGAAVGVAVGRAVAAGLGAGVETAVAIGVGVSVGIAISAGVGVGVGITLSAGAIVGVGVPCMAVGTGAGVDEVQAVTVTSSNARDGKRPVRDCIEWSISPAIGSEARYGLPVDHGGSAIRERRAIGGCPGEQRIFPHELPCGQIVGESGLAGPHLRAARNVQPDARTVPSLPRTNTRTRSLVPPLHCHRGSRSRDSLSLQSPRTTQARRERRRLPPGPSVERSRTPH